MPTPTGQAPPADGARDQQDTQPLRLPGLPPRSDPAPTPPDGTPVPPDSTPVRRGPEHAAGPSDAELHDAVLQDAGPHDAVPHDTAPHDTAPHDTAPHDTAPLQAIPPGPGRLAGSRGGPGPPGAPPPSTGDLAPAVHGTAAALSPDPRLLAWLRRAILVLAAGVIVSLLVNWRVGVTAAAVVAVIDTIYSARTLALIPASVRVTSAQRMTRRRLFFARPFGYMAVHSRAIPGTDSVIDHLVVGPSGVIAIDSERWDRRLPVRTVASAAGPVLYHGPFSQKQRLAHARWEAAQASRLLSAELRREVPVDPAMVIYGPSIPWKVASIRGVDVLGGGNVGSYLRGRNRVSRTRGGNRASSQRVSSGELGWDQAGEIFVAAERALPPALGHAAPRRARVRRESPGADG